MSKPEKAPRRPFKTDELVRVKAQRGIPPTYHLSAGLIVEVTLGTKRPYCVSLPGGKCYFAEHELERV